MAISPQGLVSLVLVVGLVAVTSSRVTASPDSILVQILGSKYTGLVRLLEEANLLADLESEERFPEGVTVFAPSDYYLVEKVSPNLLTFLSQPGNIEQLRKVLLHHIVPGKISAKAWYPGKTVTSLAGVDLPLFIEDGELKVDTVDVKELSALEAKDGVVHSINGFLVPAEVYEAAAVEESAEIERRELYTPRFLQVVADAPIGSPGPEAGAPGPAIASAVMTLLNDLSMVADGKYSTVSSLIENTPEVADTIENGLADGETFTIFPPSNTALGGVDPSTLTANTLLNHVVPQEYTYAQLQAIGSQSRRRLLGTITTVSGQQLNVTTVNGTVYVDGNRVEDPNVVSGSGVTFQGIDGVILPITSAPSPAPSSESPSSAAPAPGSGAGSKLAVASWLSLFLAIAAGALIS